jgi:hypothetical protein
MVPWRSRTFFDRFYLKLHFLDCGFVVITITILKKIWIQCSQQKYLLPGKCRFDLAAIIERGINQNRIISWTGLLNVL